MGSEDSTLYQLRGGGRTSKSTSGNWTLPRTLLMRVTSVPSTMSVTSNAVCKSILVNGLQRHVAPYASLASSQPMRDAAPLICTARPQYTMRSLQSGSVTSSRASYSTRCKEEWSRFSCRVTVKPRASSAADTFPVGAGKRSGWCDNKRANKVRATHTCWAVACTTAHSHSFR